MTSASADIGQSSMSKNYDADVIVAGAGPAGATAALSSRPRGRARAHGRALRAAAAEAVRRRHQHARAVAVSVAAATPLEPHSDAARCPSLYLEGPSGATSSACRLRGPAVLLIRRIEFDHLLASLAVEAGARLLAPAPIAQARQDADGVTLRTRDGRELRARMVIAADGVNSVIARRLGMNPGWPAAQLALDMMEETPVDVAARGRARHAVGVLRLRRGARLRLHLSEARARQRRHRLRAAVLSRSRWTDAPYDLQQRFVGDLRARGMMDGESQRGHFTPFLIPIGGPLRTTAEGRVLLAGDAGGFVNGFSAEGIYYAMVTGDLAADAIVDARARAGDASCPAHAAPRLRARVAPRDRRGAARLRPDPAVSVPQSRAHGPRRPRRQARPVFSGRSWTTRAGGCRTGRRAGACSGSSPGCSAPGVARAPSAKPAPVSVMTRGRPLRSRRHPLRSSPLRARRADRVHESFAPSSTSTPSSAITRGISR